MAAKNPPNIPKLDEMNKIVEIPVDELRFDPENPRLKGVTDGKSEATIVTTLWNEMAVDEIAMSIAHHGFFRQEPLYAQKQGDKWIVIEGNRRLAAVRVLRDPELRKKVSAARIPMLSAADIKKLDTLPVIECDRHSIWPFLGFRHINGPQPWNSYAKAQYIAWIKEKNPKITLDEIMDAIGDRNDVVKRQYRGLMVLDQAKREGVFDPKDSTYKPFPFSHLYTALSQKGFQKHLGISEKKFQGIDDKAIGFNPVPKSHVKELGEVCLWLFGSVDKKIEPKIKTQHKDLAELGRVLENDNAVACMRRGDPLEVAVMVVKGDSNVLRESLVGAKLNLEKAKGKITGFEGGADLLDLAKSVEALAVSIVEEMIRRDSGQRHGDRRKG